MLSRTLAGASLLLAMLATLGPSAFAVPPPVDCGPGTTWDGHQCKLTAVSPGEGGGSSAGVGGGGSGATAPRTCSHLDSEVPCHDTELGWWSSSMGCYVRLTTPQPPADALVWDGRTDGDGAIYDCAVPSPGLLGGSVVYTFWAASAPAGPDPAVMAETAVASMDLKPVSIGIVPEDKPGSVGLVGLPVWLWVANPTAQSWGPITRTASAGGVSVTATAKVSWVRWLMGDGEVVVCRNKGTVYEDRFGKADSPTCGYRYTKQGTYTVRAESHWVVSWSGMGRTGTIPVQVLGSTRITVGELQVLTTR